LHKSEIAKIAGKINRQGYTLVPLKMYFKDALIKMEIALCKGKHTYDKKQSIAERDVKRSVDREIKNAGF
jgi:SsrA-binding protein